MKTIKNYGGYQPEVMRFRKKYRHLIKRLTKEFPRNTIADFQHDYSCYDIAVISTYGNVGPILRAESTILAASPTDRDCHYSFVENLRQMPRKKKNRAIKLLIAQFRRRLRLPAEAPGHNTYKLTHTQLTPVAFQPGGYNFWRLFSMAEKADLRSLRMKLKRREAKIEKMKEEKMEILRSLVEELRKRQGLVSVLKGLVEDQKPLKFTMSVLKILFEEYQLGKKL